MARKSERVGAKMKRILLVILILFVLIGCSKQPETNTTDLQYPYIDNDGRLNVDVSGYEFD